MSKPLKIVGVVLLALVGITIIGVFAFLSIAGKFLSGNEKHLAETKARIETNYRQLTIPPALTLQASAWNPEQLDSHPNWNYTYAYTGTTTQAANLLESSWSVAGCSVKTSVLASFATTLVEGYCPHQSLFVKADFYNATTMSINASEEKI